MNIKKGDKTINIPGWAILVGLLVVDNLATNVCKIANNKVLVKLSEKEGGSQK